ncbi:MBOAT family O-acyltransferase [Olleya sp. YS]|uniref:MBOAT family O-acyltransferase n=1 Tax=Olleya sp. YS TaxID=3028318 RepID=UPI0024342C56|nr:MBOAT family O-acyltransferase [Olleya sp. YS]WGD35976.1 MBOAT family O-acyltransferase [Olleya sp. YS]
MVLLLLLSAIVDFSAGLVIQRGYKKVGLYLSILFNLGILCYFKYSYFIASNFTNLSDVLGVNIDYSSKFINIALPIGISFFTFQTMSYTIDVYRGKVQANKNFIDFACYVTLFPQLIAGPIVRYAEIETELQHKNISLDRFYDGCRRFIIGLSKKMLIANNCAFFADAAFSLPNNELSMLVAWVGIICYALQIYFDFSGYSDMAIGLGLMFGFTFPENFNYPYIAKSIREFWKRWHITLSNWFKDYLYIPLGGNRQGATKTYINLIIVFSLTGLWHGASWTFLIWGLWHGLFLIIERLGFDAILKKYNVLSYFYTLLVVLIGWVFFRSDTISQATNFILKLFDFKTQTNYEFFDFYFTKEVIIALIIGVCLATPLYKYILDYFNVKSKQSTTYKSYLVINSLSLLLLFWTCYYYIATNAYNPFIYFKF